MKKFIQSTAAVVTVWLFAMFQCVYAVDNPVNMLNSVSSQMIAKLKANQSTLHANPQQVFNLTYQIIVPHADLDEMSRRVLPAQIWSQASNDQREQFKREFTKLLVRTYASALTEYKDETINFFPVRGDYQHKTSVTVKSVILRSQAPSIPVNYRLVLRNGEWRLVDLSVEGVSLLESFRSQFSDVLAQGNINSLLQRLIQHNSVNGG